LYGLFGKQKKVGLLSRLLWEAAKYPPTLRIAARLHLEGITVEGFDDVCKFPKVKDTPQQIRDEVEQYLGEMARGDRRLDSRLQELAMALEWPT